MVKTNNNHYIYKKERDTCIFSKRTLFVGVFLVHCHFTMSTVVGSVSTKDVNFNPEVGEEEVVRTMNQPQEEDQIIIIQEDDQDNILKLRRGMDLGPQFSLKEQLDKDKVQISNNNGLFGFTSQK